MSARQRCYRRKDTEFANYGGRGISMCDKWRNFAAFYADMGPKPTPQHSLDRINNDGNYEPGNCRWTTQIEQSSNRRITVRITHNGETLTISQWARRLGIRPATLLQRKFRGAVGDQILHPISASAQKATITRRALSPVP